MHAPPFGSVPVLNVTVSVVRVAANWIGIFGHPELPQVTTAI